MSVRFRSLRPMLRTKNLHGTVKSWTDCLGLTCKVFSDEDGWASLDRDAVSLMIAVPNAHLPFEAPAFTGSLYLDVDDVDALWSDVKHRVRVACPMEDFEYGMREFAIYDNNGYMPKFGSPLSS